MKAAFSILAISLVFTHLALAANEAQFNISANAVTESGEHLATGTFTISRTNGILKYTDYGTKGTVKEPVPMYMLFSYVRSPTMELFKFPLTKGKTWTQGGRWDARAETTIEAHEAVEVPAGIFPDSLKHKTIITGTQAKAEGGSEFVNGTRYLWFAKDVGLVKMIYEHSNGMTTKAELTKYDVVDKSEEYLPLKIGNTWTYKWKNDYRDEAVVETCRVGELGETDVKTPISPKKKSYTPTTKEVRITGMEKLDLSQDVLAKISANSKKRFNFPYYLFVPRAMDPNKGIHILVESNNTGRCSDDFEIHDRSARRLAESSHAHKMAEKLRVPLLVPVFPRPQSQWRMYTHSLDEETLLLKTGPLKRIDLQLIEMIKDAQELLKRNNVEVKNKVFMHGFSGSGTFSNRFAILHPGIVRAVASGGVNSIPTFPTGQWRDTTLPYPVGIADLKEIADIDFDENAYKKVSQYIYMGYMDRSDTTDWKRYKDAYDVEHAKLIRTLIGAEMPKRWKVSQSIYKELQIPAQMVTYNGTGHRIRSEMIDDIVEFFTANSADAIVEIEPHQYPFVEYRELQEVHINGVYWKGDERIPSWCRDLFSGKGSFIISIRDWLDGQNHMQLRAFKKNAGFNFLLKADEREDILITDQDFRGNYSSNDGSFQGFVVGLDSSQLEKMASGVEYSIVPINENKEYPWKVREGVRLIKPSKASDSDSEDTPEKSSIPTKKDTTPPRIAKTIPDFSEPVPVDTREIKIVFSEKMGPRWSMLSTLPRPKLSWDTERKVLTILVEDMQTSTTYTMSMNPEGYVNRFEDVSGNHLKMCTLSFTVEATGEQERIMELLERGELIDSDTDGDGLSDYDEYCKYRTDPMKKDSDGDSTPDGDWDERREYAYTIRSVVKVMRPCNNAVINDAYQDAKVLSETEKYVELEVIHYPFNNIAVSIKGSRNWKKPAATLKEYVKPGPTTNWDDEMRQALLAELRADGIIVDELTDKQIVERVSSWLISRSRSLDKVFTTYYVHFPDGQPKIYPGLEAAFEGEFNRDKDNYDWTIEKHFDYELLGKGMFYNKTHGSCTSFAVYLTTVLRALGIPTRMIIAIPAIDSNDEDQLKLVEKGISNHEIRQSLLRAFRSLRGFAAHTFNEVHIGGRWYRLDGSKLGVNILSPGMGLMTHVHTFCDLSEADLARTWGWRYGKHKLDSVFQTPNPYRTTELTDYFGVHCELENPEVVTQSILGESQFHNLH